MPEQQVTATESTLCKEAKNAAKNASKKKKSRDLCLDREDVIARADEKTCSEESGPPSADYRPATTRDLRNDWRFESVPSDTSSLNKLNAPQSSGMSPRRNRARPRSQPRRNARASIRYPSCIHRRLSARPC